MIIVSTILTIHDYTLFAIVPSSCEVLAIQPQQQACSKCTTIPALVCNHLRLLLDRTHSQSTSELHIP